MKQTIHWVPRILTILAILFVSVFALDSFSPDLTPGQQILGFLIHLIPSFILTIVLVVAWKYKFTGGIIFVALGISLSMFLFLVNYGRNQDLWITLGIMASISLPFVISGMLFIVDHFYSGNPHQHNTSEIN